MEIGGEFLSRAIYSALGGGGIIAAALSFATMRRQTINAFVDKKLAVVMFRYDQLISDYREDHDRMRVEMDKLREMICARDCDERIK